MSLYNMIMGMNAELVALLSCILDERIDKTFPRFRDAFRSADDCPIENYDYLIFTRMGGDNYEHWNERCTEVEPCPFCNLLKIEERETYLGGYDDKYDNTYRILAFKFTPEQKQLFESMMFVREQMVKHFPEVFEQLKAEEKQHYEQIEMYTGKVGDC